MAADRGHDRHVVGALSGADPEERVTEPVFFGLQVIPGLQVDPEPRLSA